ncbi:division/cell wall cluster transcriptional repressor MraZ [Fructilactobacillus sanfranciscensis]|uniref:Transcriptional regulator MraZ n=2 Tax=Fructilactobacillus sanfranciscensis TaxID=1625 RepID=G2KUG3_FRUST|nr:division/cell wall cluster transcriptional repressor MraZ [Fructilactobacillus sanfranciscensis]AEN99417.1 Protein mraZ [Fructilactobacillus sanfranciscensis TMW 1.1304]MCG7194095.1 transcriptional regulator MraZ [Fructilactobacillus sanfranciscensis]MCG7195356.1 transcriptional regulator MraZ [Fructilactobacillus sanfranciscensis]MDN4461591.1 division/cell wall cluster transcriptional repressor MraZ [Fructilactobacillus sanfranciscensis]MVF15318.1 transcriptional regulator MraZ [Fructilact
MFMGEYRHNIDSKGRIIIPAKFREQLSQVFVITRGLDGCLFGYSAEEWEKVQAEVDKLPFNKKDARTFSRLFFSAATECEIDKQGRVNLPSSLVKYAGLVKNCVLTGVSTRFEIWDADKWDTYTEESQDDFNEIAENLLDF